MESCCVNTSGMPRGNPTPAPKVTVLMRAAEISLRRLGCRHNHCRLLIAALGHIHFTTRCLGDQEKHWGGLLGGRHLLKLSTTPWSAQSGPVTHRMTWVSRRGHQSPHGRRVGYLLISIRKWWCFTAESCSHELWFPERRHWNGGMQGVLTNTYLDVNSLPGKRSWHWEVC